MNMNIWGDFQICISVPLTKRVMFVSFYMKCYRKFNLNYIETIHKNALTEREWSKPCEFTEMNVNKQRPM